ncbi:MAG: ATP-binding protein [Nanoarchaeota archaeon]|nr:ATP-binding protein [Nanoarchaeota archaeon]
MELIRILLNEWNEKVFPKIFPRTLSLEKYLSFKVKKIIVLSGFRRVGKTYLLLNLINALLGKKSKKEIIYFNFEDERIPLKTEFLSDLFSNIVKANGKKPDLLFLDEIQNFPFWSKWLRRVYDTSNTKFFVTGSSSKMSLDKIPTELRGRYILIKVFPLSFSEFLSFKGIDKKISNDRIVNLFGEYLVYGGLPEVTLASKEEKLEIIRSYYLSVVNKDLIETYSLKNKEVLKALLGLLLNSTNYSYTKLYNSLSSLGYSIGKSSLIHYVNSIEDSFFMFSVPIFSYKIKNRMQYPKKHYFVDNSFVSKVSTNFSNNYGRLYENLVAVSLLKEDFDVFYWKNEKGEEVDFVILENNHVRSLIQVCYDISDSDTLNREIRALLKAGQELKCKNLVILNNKKEGIFEKEWFGIKGKIKFVLLWKWCLENNNQKTFR